MTTLIQAWMTASAALPRGWELSLLTLDLIEADGTRHWLAGAVEYEDGMPKDHLGDEHYERGWGATREEALLDLAEKLRTVRGDPNG